jgi:hypothetical protein
VAIIIDAGRPSVLIRKESYEKSGLARPDIDARFNLTDQEFRVEGNLVIVGPLPSDDLVGPLVDYLESAGLTYFDDFCELSGNWPEWLRVYVM